MLKSEFLVIAQANQQPCRPLPHRIQAQLLLVVHRLQRQTYRLHLLQAVLLKVMRVDLMILAPMACAAVSGAIVVQLTHTVENAAKAIVMGSLLHRLVQARPAQVRLQQILRHLLGSTMGPTAEKIAASLHMLGTGKLVPLKSKLMLIHTLSLHLQYPTLGHQARTTVMLNVKCLVALHFATIKHARI